MRVAFQPPSLFQINSRTVTSKRPKSKTVLVMPSRLRSRQKKPFSAIFTEITRPEGKKVLITEAKNLDVSSGLGIL